MIIIPTEKRFDWKHTPVMLFLIVLINTLVFFFYQSGDNEKFYKALENYKQQELLELEWPVFKTFLSSKEEVDKLAQYQEMYDSDAKDSLIVSLLMREDFYDYLQQNSQTFLAGKMVRNNKLQEWSTARENINEIIQSVSFNKLGLIPNRLNPLNLFTHQFLHGGAMHLLGNMFFLIVCGFAVEAALGHMRFLIFYLISGIAGGLLYAAIDLSSATSLVGASGAISGVMAMYLGIFRLKKIEFFYWFFIFVGYFRAPALLLLLFYIGKELFAFYTDTNSNVAFMAHTGGFIAGSILLAVSFLINPKMLNQEYIEEDQSIDPIQEKLAKVYSRIENYSFDSALTNLQTIILEHGITFDLAVLRYNLLKIIKPSDYDNYLIDLLKMKPPTPFDIKKLESVWLENPLKQDLLDEDNTIKLGLNFATIEQLNSAEEIFKRLHENACQSQALGFLARKISIVYETSGRNTKQAQYEKFADKLSMGSL